MFTKSLPAPNSVILVCWAPGPIPSLIILTLTFQAILCDKDEHVLAVQPTRICVLLWLGMIEFCWKDRRFLVNRITTIFSATNSFKSGQIIPYTQVAGYHSSCSWGPQGPQEPYSVESSVLTPPFLGWSHLYSRFPKEKNVQSSKDHTCQTWKSSVLQLSKVS